MRRGVTVIELAVVVLIVGILCGVGIPALLRRLDRTRVRSAVNEIVGGLALARTTAVARGRHITVAFDSARARFVVSAAADTILSRSVGDIYGVSLASNRDSTIYASSGLGYGAANQSIVVRRGDEADTIIISRLGRVRH